MKLKKKQVWIIIALVIIGGSYYWYKKTHPANTQIQYITESARIGTLTTSVSASGNIIVDQQATVDPTITGTISDLSVKVGDKVEKGQFLFNIINDDLSVSVAKAAASYESAKISLESTKIDKDSAKATYEKAKDEDDDDDSAYTKEEFGVLKDKTELAKAKIVQSQMSLSASLADYRNVQANAGKRKVTAPISGTVQGINIKNGDDLSRVSGSSNSSAPIIIGDSTTLKAEVQVNEVDIANVSLGQKAVLSLDALPETDFSGKVEKIDSLGTVEQGVVTYNVTIGFDSLDERIKPDMSVSANIINNVKQDALIVPNSAVKSEGDNYYVEILNNGVLQQASVEIGAANNNETEIISGIKEGDEIVTQTINPNATGTQSSSSQSNGVRIPGLGGGGFHRD